MKPVFIPLSVDDVRARLRELAKGRGVTLAALSRMIGEDDAYLRRFGGAGAPDRLPAHARQLLAAYLRVDPRELDTAADG